MERCARQGSPILAEELDDMHVRRAFAGLAAAVAMTGLVVTTAGAQSTTTTGSTTGAGTSAGTSASDTYRIGLEAPLSGDQKNLGVGMLDGALSRFGKQYVGEPDEIAAELAQDAAVRAADTLLLTVPNQLGVDYNASMLKTIADHIAPAIGWAPAAARVRATARA